MATDLSHFLSWAVTRRLAGIDLGTNPRDILSKGVPFKLVHGKGGLETGLLMLERATVFEAFWISA